jgi:hypothetical protein
MDIPDEQHRQVNDDSLGTGADWLASWLEHSILADPAVPTAREIVVAGRDRLDARRVADHWPARTHTR